MEGKTPQQGGAATPGLSTVELLKSDLTDIFPRVTPTTTIGRVRRSRFAGLTILTVLALLYTVHLAREFLMPIAFAVLLSFLLSPAVRGLQKLRIPPGLGAAFVVLGLIGVSVVGVYGLTGPVQSWAAKAPQSLETAQRELKKLMRPLERISKTAEQVTSTAGDLGPAKQPTEVVVRGPTLASRLLGSGQRIMAGLLEVLILLYFLLAAGDLFLQKMIHVLPNLPDKLKAIRIARDTERSISTYLVTTLLINATEGAVTAIALYFFGMPNAVLWGVMVAVLEFVPYLGAVTMTAILGIAALGVFPTLGHAMLVPAIYLGINIIQANVVSPLLLGHNLALNPVALFIGLAFWFWTWGIPGAFIGVPLLATFKICCDHIESLAPIGEFLGGRRERAGRTKPA